LARCIERKLLPSLNLLLSSGRCGVGNLFLRWVGSSEAYVKASLAGWRDLELEKRLVLIQRLWRTRKIHKIPCYEGPVLEDYENLRNEGKLREGYFGYRHTLYKLRWDRKNRHRFYRSILTFDRWGDCAWQAYCDLLKENEDRMPSKIQISSYEVLRLRLTQKLSLLVLNFVM